jgi:nicotinate-nucleotide pyrophosphorylase (carboxylating)
VKRVPFTPLDPGLYRDLVRRALAEDIGHGDVTTRATVDPMQRARAVVLVKSPLVLAGLDIAAEAFRQLDPDVRIRFQRQDGDRCEAGVEVGEIRGLAAALLTAERTALNFIQRLCGVATLTRRFVDVAADRIIVLDTRKTTPLWRTLEKYAVRAGGGVNHRHGLDDGILIKDNHIRLACGVHAAVARMRAAELTLPLEIEAQSLEQVDAALDAGADIILLDNLSTPDIIAAVAKCRGRARTEISGGVTLDRLPELAVTGADYVSVGALTHSAPSADISLEIEPE